MFLYADVVQAPKHKYIVVGIDDSNPKDIQYELIRDNKSNREDMYQLISPKFTQTYWYRASVLKYVESIPR